MLPFISSFLIFAFFAVERKNCAIGEGFERNQVKPTQKDQIIPWVHDPGHAECIPKLKRLNDLWINATCAICTKTQFLFGILWSKLSTLSKTEKKTKVLLSKTIFFKIFQRKILLRFCMGRPTNTLKYSQYVNIKYQYMNTYKLG